MADRRHVAAMDPPHITEFASERYFEKLNQLHTNQQHAEPSESSTTTTTTTTTVAATVSSTSRFILPLRESKALETDTIKPADSKRDRSRFFSIRQKVSLLHSRSDSDSPIVPQPRASTESTRRSIPLDQLFLALPNELQLQIISALPLPDLLNLRLASKSWHALITLNEVPIVRHHLDHHIPAYALRLYPIRDSTSINFHYLCSLWHRLHVAAKLSYLMSEWITKDIFLRQTEAQRVAFAPQHERMRRRLIPLLFTVFHFFESYRKVHLQRIVEHNGRGLLKEPYTVNPIETHIMNMYDNQTLLRVHEVFPLVISSFCRRLRPPTYVGRVERSLRGYLRERPSDEIHVAILCLGGLRQVERLWEIKGYNNRRSAVDNWYNSLAKETSVDAPLKGRLGLKSFGRKKSTSGERPHRTSISEGGRRSPWGSMDASAAGGLAPYSVFNTSLAADAPMAPLERDQTKTLLGDLPALQHIWLTTAEAMILDRQIVQRPQDIKRNQQVMLDLIREDGIDEEDEWWYGRNIPDSVRPPAGALGDDAD